MKFYKTILVLGLVVGDYSVSSCDLRTQQEFEKICLSGGHTQASCDCIYQRLEQVYSPQLMQRLEHVSLQSPALPQDFAPTFFSVMRRCDKNDMG
ncbi:TPA: hypothetical protein OMP93_000564 [Acinetobacter baumannii]|uniref:Uncharacterized protein n=1 Tax=Acinetobacter baumannii TaxID=470 RepID=A0A7S8ZUT9_ACIBA|nr:hypothetical protein [Acinetobacter baumannii]MCZ3127546.1 hypothetical protein [Acinetobacter baumannii]MDH2667756.1 hypothetical protein [Acinetobacter baumannii]MDO7385627.1 hypothetical protein [Acinetobacter baumannii]QPF14199.1 hypothetical protein IMO23_04480 [Acinetobacter baumannii]HCQ9568840.1 hypothetical protein [Acinetobacter baumannii]